MCLWGLEIENYEDVGNWENISKKIFYKPLRIKLL